MVKIVEILLKWDDLGVPLFIKPVVNNGINYQPQLVSRIFSINSITKKNRGNHGKKTGGGNSQVWTWNFGFGFLRVICQSLRYVSHSFFKAVGGFLWTFTCHCYVTLPNRKASRRIWKDSIDSNPHRWKPNLLPDPPQTKVDWLTIPL